MITCQRNVCLIKTWAKINQTLSKLCELFQSHENPNFVWLIRKICFTDSYANLKKSGKAWSCDFLWKNTRANFGVQQYPFDFHIIFYFRFNASRLGACKVFLSPSPSDHHKTESYASKYKPMVHSKKTFTHDQQALDFLFWALTDFLS